LWIWRLADLLVRDHPMVVDRPADSRHPRLPGVMYPCDYGYLAGTGAIDGDGAILTVDVIKADSEVKWLIGCTMAEMNAVLETHRTGWQQAVLIVRNRESHVSQTGP
jgi:inorganic pyrophosphatase